MDSDSLPLWSSMTGAGHYQPSNTLTNYDLEAMLDTSSEWITTRTGIRERRIADSETLADMAARASIQALASAGVSGTDIDLIVIATMTAVDHSPSTAAQVAARIGAISPALFDLNAACAGFSQALAVADHAIRCGDIQRALVVGAEKMSDFLDWNDRSSAILMADGAGAIVLEASPRRGVSPVAWGSDPQLAHLVRIQEPDGKFRIEGPSVFRWAITHAQQVGRDALARAGLTAGDLVAFVPHQANLRIIDALAQQLGIDSARTVRDVVESGNTSAASIPIALSKLLDSADGRGGGPALLLSFGGGFCYSAQVVELPASGRRSAGTPVTTAASSVAPSFG